MAILAIDSGRNCSSITISVSCSSVCDDYSRELPPEIRQPSVGHRGSFIFVEMFGTSMTTATDDESQMLVDVSLPPSLLEEIDQYARVHGYPTRSAVVAKALEE